jgi:hypothetical protein
MKCYKLYTELLMTINIPHSHKKRHGDGDLAHLTGSPWSSSLPTVLPWRLEKQRAKEPPGPSCSACRAPASSCWAARWLGPQVARSPAAQETGQAASAGRGRDGRERGAEARPPGPRGQGRAVACRLRLPRPPAAVLPCSAAGWTAGEESRDGARPREPRGAATRDWLLRAVTGDDAHM